LLYGKRLSIPIHCQETGKFSGNLVVPEDEYVVWVEDYGRYLKLQYDSDGNVRHVRDIMQPYLRGLCLYIRKQDRLVKSFYLPFNGRDDTLVYYFHNQVTIGGAGPEHVRYLVFGKKSRRKNEEIQYRLLVDGVLELVAG